MNFIGRLGEEIAQKEYFKLGFKILDKNVFNRSGKQAGEIDFIALSKHRIIFVEVKSRSSEVSRFGRPEEAVNIYKQIKLLKAVKIFLLTHPEFENLVPSIDVCLVNIDEVDTSLNSVKIISNAVEDWN